MQHMLNSNVLWSACRERGLEISERFLVPLNTDPSHICNQGKTHEAAYINSIFWGQYPSISYYFSSRHLFWWYLSMYGLFLAFRYTTNTLFVILEWAPISTVRNATGSNHRITTLCTVCSLKYFSNVYIYINRVNNNHIFNILLL
jgi:hypothetical protein